MSTNYALIKNNKVENIIVGGEGEESLQILKMFYSEMDEIIEVTESNGPAWIGGDYIDKEFKNIKPFSSWIWDSVSKQWNAPKPSPIDKDKIFYWDESANDWSEFTE